ncbi:HD-GYP domain-containing protein [Phycisphaerales bacterium AB-hyl4]|uniref:HD-GYP domain-containing protein n=1 Tax=Natronomicrosphaera hydrolytica TaxID=3242702 RepID=A0ABV4TZX1_9BACT
MTKLSITQNSDARRKTDCLHSRLTTLKVSVVQIEVDGRVHAMRGAGWLEQQVVACPAFTATLRSRVADLESSVGEVVEPWPGVWLLPLPSGRRRRSEGRRNPELVLAGLMLGPDFLQADQFQLVCQHAQLDAQVVRNRVQLDQLFGRVEAERLALTLDWMQRDLGELERRDRELEGMSQELADSYEELSLLYKLSSSMTVNQSPRTFLTDACSDLQQVAGLRWMTLQLIDHEPRLESFAGELFRAGPLNADTKTIKNIGRHLMRRMGDQINPVVVDDTTSLNIAGLDSLSQSLLMVPLHSDGRLLGLLLGGDKLDGTHLGSIDSKLCSSLANSLSIFLDNMMLYDDMQSMFMGTLHALTAAIDAKDSYTHGHSERVAQMSRALARAAGLDEAACERVYVAGLVHDVGKIGVPESVLCKPGRLTEEEFGLIKRHPEIGARILQDIRQMSDLIPGVLYHHERWDGRGYPHGLKGEGIPLFGRLIGLADAFDAMSSDRTYRRGMAMDEVLKEMHRCSGSQFDPELVKLFVKLDFGPYFQMIKRHQNEEVRKSA